MTALATPDRALNTAEFDIDVRAVRSGTPPELGLLGDSSTGWSADYELLFHKLKFAAWPNTGHARLGYISLAGTFEPVEENLLNRYWVDDQVRITMFPPTFSSGAPIGVGTGTAGGDGDAGGVAEADASGGVVIFEGAMQRQSFSIRATGDRDDEDTTIVAIDAPTLDNLDPAHLVRGRWVQDPADAAGTPLIIDGPFVPAVFNSGGRPNMMPTDPMTAHDGGIGLSAQLFTFDGDHRAEFWTPRKAIVSILTMWLYGHSTASGTAKTRSATLEVLTAQALLDDTMNAGRWNGLDAILPEVSVQGLGVFDALNKVCRAAGFQMSVTPPLGRRPAEVEDAAAIDRLYQVRLWRVGNGPDGSVRLQARPAHDAASLSAAAELKANNTDTLTGLADAVPTRNHVIATGPVLVETTVELKPYWASGDVDGGSVVRRLQMMVPGNTTEQYHSRHVIGGDEFEDYGHVGRLWGVDCTGQFRSAGLGYTTPAAYAHDADGFDWLAHLEIDGADDLTVERTANGVTDPIAWTKRPRRPMPLTRPGLEHLERPYLLEVSEDGGSAWTVLPATAFDVLQDSFAIKIKDTHNLANVNADFFVNNAAPPEVSASWWGLIKTNNLRFRLTCLIEADHAQRFDATRQTGSGTLYTKATQVRSSAVTVYASPSSTLHNSASWAKIDDGGFGASTAGADREQLLQDLAERTRDERELIRLALSGATWLMDPAMVQVGDRVTSIEGRDLPLHQTSSSGEQRSPSVVSVTITGAPEGSQGISYDLSDESMRRGV